MNNDSKSNFGDSRDQTYKTRVDIGFKPEEKWKTAPAIFGEHSLKILGHPVMEDWELLYMKELAKIATTNSGVVLELGFGMGISSKFIQKQNIEKHIIIEANHQVVEEAKKFQENAPHKVEIIEGFWQEVINKIPDESIDGILFDTYPMSEIEIHKNHYSFFKTAFQKLKTGGVFTYYSDEINSYSNSHMKKLLEAGFKKENINGRIVSVDPPQNCEYWKSKTLLAPIVVK